MTSGQSSQRVGIDAVLELARDLPQTGTLDQAVQVGLDAAVRSLEWDGALLAELVPPLGALVVLGSVGEVSQRHQPGNVLSDLSPEGRVSKTDEIFIGVFPATPGVPGRAGVVVPLHFGPTKLGVLSVSRSAADWVEPEDDALLRLGVVAELVSAAIAGHRSRADLVVRLEQMDALGRVAHALTGIEDAERTMRRVAEEGMQVFDAERAGTFLFDRFRKRTECVVSLGLSEAYVDAIEKYSVELRTTQALLDREPVFLGPEAQRRPGPIADAVKREGWRSAALLPLVFGGETIGALAFYHDRPKHYTSEERRLAVAFADQAALAIGKSRLLDQVSRVKREWQMAFDAAGSGLAVVGQDGLIVRANRFVAKLADVKLTELPDLDLRTLFRHWPAAGDDPLARASETGHPVSAMLDGKDGRLLVVTATPLAEGGLVVAIDDLTQIVRLETRFRRVVETAQDAIVLTEDDDESIAFANPAAAELVGLSTSELVGRSLKQYLVPVDRPPGHRAPRFETDLQRPDGGVRRVAVSLATLSDDSGSGQVAVLRDISQAHEALLKLRRSEVRYRTLFSSAPLAILTLDRTGRFLSYNDAALALLGRERLGPEQRLFDFVPQRELESLQDNIQRSFAGELDDFAVRVVRSDGSVRETTVVVAQLPEVHEQPALLAIVRDVTEELRLRERVFQAEKMASLGHVVSGVAHELNNPVAGINALAQTLILEEPLDDGTRRVLESIRREGERAAGLVSDLLTSARQRPLERHSVQLNEVVERAMEVASEIAGEDNQSWRFERAGDLPRVSADPDQIQQVLANLLANARQAMGDGAGAQGMVRTYLTEDGVACEVIDSGPGIPDESLGRVFEPFYTTKVVGAGTGLGLAISRGIIEAHGGSIGADNRPEGGARFWFELPR